MATSQRLVIDEVHKTMGAVRALDGVSIDVRQGTVHGIIGHNGSGKSTLVKILSGVLPADRGSYLMVDQDAGGRTFGRAPRVACVFQDLGLAEDLSVLDNLLVNSFRAGRAGFISLGRERRRAREVMAAVGLNLNLDTAVSRLAEADRVMLCVARALMRAGVRLEDGPADPADQGAVSADLLVMDEPTSSLPRDELERFRDLVRRLRDDTGVTMLVVTHNPSDISAFCDDFTALKNGKVLRSMQASDVTAAMLAEMMSGQAQVAGPAEPGGGHHNGSSGASAGTRQQTGADPVFVADELMTPQLSGPVSLSAAPGELVGITGLEGSGFREFIRAAMGVADTSSGTVTIRGTRLRGSAAALRKAGAIFIPSDRSSTSGVPVATAYENMTLGRVDAYARRGVISLKREKAAVAGMMERLNVLPADPHRLLSQMSGGQQQKVVVGRALLSGVSLLVFEEPTAAVDVGAREAILADLRKVTEGGRTVIVASGEFEWMSAVCDRIVVFRSGGVAGELLPGQMGEEAILRLAYGD